MFDHNGTYMRGVALQQKNVMIVVETAADFEEDIRGTSIDRFSVYPTLEFLTTHIVKFSRFILTATTAN